IERRKAKIGARGADWPAALEEAGAQLWFRNNLICSLLALGPFVVIGRCGVDVLRCAGSSGVETLLPAPLLPSSPVVVSTLYAAADRLMAWAGSLIGGVNADGRISILLWVLGILLFNSVFDLWKTGKYYLVLEEIEWE